ncbi:MAG: transcriptional repressor [Chloroflexi bacterium]|nr:transcriptional repressor [Chloroflexota bacterium]MBM4451940.1 transcriptional repressor [Chloroflexota bacterium]
MQRQTKQKRAILKALMGTRSHPTAEWIYGEVRKEIPSISLGTVYRNLRLMADAGDILELDMCGSLSRFDARRDNHYHFRCERCGEVCDVDEPVNIELDKKVAKMTGFAVSYHKLVFVGLCRECPGKPIPKS